MAYQNLDLLLDRATASAPPNPRRAGVRRSSRRKGSEGTFWRAIRPADLRVLIRAAERLELTGRQSGARNGPLGYVALEVLRELARLVDFKTGRLDPCYSGIAMRIRRSRSAVVEAFKRLRAAGFVDWIRRYEPDARPGERGPQVKQTSNAFRFCMPACVARLLGVYAVAPPLPLDEEARQEAKRRQADAWDFDGSPLFQALQRLGSAVSKRETGQRSETQGVYLSKKGIAE